MFTTLLETMMQDEWQNKFRAACEQIAYCSVNYVFSLVVLILVYPASQAIIAPLLSSFMPISHTSLPKAVMIMSLMYWAPVMFHIIKRWRNNTLV